MSRAVEFIPDSWRNKDLHEHTEPLKNCEHCGVKLEGDKEFEDKLCERCFMLDFEGKEINDTL